MILTLATAALAFPPPSAPKTTPTTSPTPFAGQGELAYGSTLFFVLDDKISSGRTAPGATLRMHLQTALVVNGVTLAPAGTPDSLVVVSTRRSQSGDVDGAVQIHVDALRLPRGQKLPLRAVHEYLTIERTAGQESTRETTDTLADIFVPGHIFYHAFRKGREMVVPAGSVLRVETNATIDASDPHAVVISTPPPLASEYDTPHSDLTPVPFSTPVPAVAPSARGRPKPAASPAGPQNPGVAPRPSPSPAASGSPSAAPAPSPERKQP